MEIIYVSSTCSKKKYKDLVEDKGLRNQQQSQKYNYLLAEGLSKNEADVRMVSVKPINRTTDHRIIFRKETENEDNICFLYPGFVNIPVLRNISVFFGVLFTILHLPKEKAVILCDAMNITAAAAALLSKVIKRIQAVAIITDVPCHRPQKESPHLYERINLAIMRKFDAYLLLTEEMNNIVNPNGKPHIVLEGHADMQMSKVENRIEDKYKKKICIYAGSTKQMYGVDILIDGFIKANVEDSELHIYGCGDYDEKIKEFSMKYPDKIVFQGIAPNHVVVNEELKAWLLINPRPTSEEYTKYSFPSKNMEYMVSGTALLTTKLPGMPEDHIPYVFLIEDETADGICEALRECFSLDNEELYQKGLQAKKFVIEHKNNMVQANKVMKFLSFVK